MSHCLVFSSLWTTISANTDWGEKNMQRIKVHDKMCLLIFFAAVASAMGPILVRMKPSQTPILSYFFDKTTPVATEFRKAFAKNLPSSFRGLINRLHHHAPIPAGASNDEVSRLRIQHHQRLSSSGYSLILHCPPHRRMGFHSNPTCSIFFTNTEPLSRSFHDWLRSSANSGVPSAVCASTRAI